MLNIYTSWIQVFTAKGLERTPGKTLVRSLEHTTPAILGAGNPNLTPVEKARTVSDCTQVVLLHCWVVMYVFHIWTTWSWGCARRCLTMR